MKIKLMMPWGGRPKGTVIEIVPGLAQTLIDNGVAVLVEQVETKEREKRARVARNK